MLRRVSASLLCLGLASPAIGSEPPRLQVLGHLDAHDTGDSELGVEAPDDSAIWGGTDVTGSNYKNVVVLFAYDPVSRYGAPFCSGTHITSRWILTAAHCIEPMYTDYAGYDLYVAYDNDVYGVSALDAIRVSQMISHQSYDPNRLGHNDIGLLQLQSSRSGADPAILNDEAVTSTWFGKNMRFVGYGLKGENNPNSSGVKRTGLIPMIACWNPAGGYESSCSASAATNAYFHANGTNICSGDSGGAAFEVRPDGTLELAGVNSWGTTPCEDGGSAVVRVDKYIDWIKSRVPSVATEPGGTEPDPDPDTDTDTDPGTDPDTDTDPNTPGLDTGWTEPARPHASAYEVLGLCSSVPGGSGAPWLLALVGLVPALRRRR